MNGGEAAVLVVGAAGASRVLPQAWAFVKGAAKVPYVLEAVTKEFSPNSGSTMKDSLNRIEAEVSSLRTDTHASVREAHDRVQLVEIRVTKHDDRLDALEYLTGGKLSHDQRLDDLEHPHPHP